MRPGRYPAQGQLLLPLLDVLDQAGEAPPRTIYTAVAQEVGLSPEVREERSANGVRLWDRHARWTEQRARQQGLTETSRRPAV